MADGDDAADAGLAVFPPDQDLRLGYNNDNIRGDEIAQEKTARVAADALKLDAAKVLVQASTPTNIPGTGYSGRIWIKKA